MADSGLHTIKYSMSAMGDWYAKMREHNPHLPDPEFVDSSQLALVCGLYRLPALTITVFVNLPVDIVVEPDPEPCSPSAGEAEAEVKIPWYSPSAGGAETGGADSLVSPASW